MQRSKVGLIAIALLVGAGVLYVVGGDDTQYQAFAAACVRIGAVMAVLWLALPAAKQLKNPWLLAIWIVGAIVLVIRPRFLPWVVLIGVVLYFLRPRTRKR